MCLTLCRFVESEKDPVSAPVVLWLVRYSAAYEPVGLACNTCCVKFQLIVTLSAIIEILSV